MIAPHFQLLLNLAKTSTAIIFLLVEFSVSSCSQEAKQATESTSAADANLGLLRRLTPRIGHLTLADTVFENLQLVLVDSCAAPLLSTNLGGWPKQCGAITVEWNYVRPVLLIGRLLEPRFVDAVLVPVVPEEPPDSARYPVRLDLLLRQIKALA